jgi:hypothetical protein
MKFGFICEALGIEAWTGCARRSMCRGIDSKRG